MDHGSHTFYLTFDWLGSYPTAVTAKMSNLEPAQVRHRGQLHRGADFPERPRPRASDLDRGRPQGDLHGPGRARRDHGRRRRSADRGDASRLTGPDVAQGAVTWDVEKRSIASHWMDASHVSWFNSLFDQFKTAIATGRFRGAGSARGLSLHSADHDGLSLRVGRVP